MRRPTLVVAGTVSLLAAGGIGFVAGHASARDGESDRFSRCERVIEALEDQPRLPPAGTRVPTQQYAHYAYPSPEQIEACYDGDPHITHG